MTADQATLANVLSERDLQVGCCLMDKKSENLRNDILSAAGRLLCTRGAAGATTKEIAAEAGCAEGSLYRHFPDKAQLLLAAAEKQLPTLHARLDMGDRELSPYFEEAALAIIDHCGKLLPLAASLAADVELLERNRQQMRAQCVGPHKLFEHLAERFAAEQSKGRIRDSLDPLALATLLAGPCFHYAYLRFFAGDVPLWDSPTEFARSIAAPLSALASPELSPQTPTKRSAKKKA